MALQAWDKNYREQLKIQQQEIESLQQQLMIGADPLPHPSEDDRQIPNPNQKPSSPYLPGKSPHKLAGLQINPNSIMLPFVPKDAETDEDYGEGNVPGHPDWKISHGEYFDEYGQPIQDPGFGIDPGGNPIRLPHMEQTPEEAEQNRQLHMDKYHQAGATSRQIRDRLKGFTRGGPYDEQGGSLRGVPDALRIQLLRDAMAGESPQSDLQIASARMNLGGGRYLTPDDVKLLRHVFGNASERERDRLIKMYSDRPFQGLV